jgi:predicted amidophosphoribosyltransferase
MAWVVVLAGYKPTPAEELTGVAEAQEPKGCCARCGEDLYFKDEKVICRVCAKIPPAVRQAQSMEPLKDPDFVRKSVATVRAKQQTEAAGD